jgi:hypothetical protein
VGKLRKQWSELGFEKKLGIVIVPVLLAIISGVVVPVLNRQADKIGATPPARPDSNLELVDLAVSGGARPRCLHDPPNPQRIDLTVRNTGDLPALVKRVAFRVTNFGLIRIPQAGGGLEPSKDYDILLPPNPRIGQSVAYKVSQQIPPRMLDRFTVRLDVPEPARQEGDRLYQLDVSLLHDTDARPMKAGTVVVSAPNLPAKDFFWAGVPPKLRAGFRGSTPFHTMVANERVFRRMLALPGERSPELALDLVDVPATDTTSGNPCARK